LDGAVLITPTTARDGPRSWNRRQCWRESEQTEAEYDMFRSGSALVAFLKSKSSGRGASPGACSWSAMLAASSRRGVQEFVADQTANHTPCAERRNRNADDVVGVRRSVRFEGSKQLTRKCFFTKALLNRTLDLLDRK
jgi:hypothetical protein